jgi:dihydrodipicolinate synthase/N-acetylneuraminate lyase
MGIKNSSGNVLQIIQQITIRNDQRRDFAVLTGSDESIYALVNCGANGSFTAIGYLYPDLIANVYKNLKNEKGLHYQEIVVKLAALAGSIPYPLGYRILGEASGRMDFGKYMQAVSAERMKEYMLVKCRMQEILKQLQ